MFVISLLKKQVIIGSVLKKEMSTVHKYDVVLNYTPFLLQGTERKEGEVQVKSYNSN